MVRVGRFLLLIVLAGAVHGVSLGEAIVCDADSDCWYVPPGLGPKRRAPALLILSCTGATATDVDTCRIVADSLGWVLATCHATRNHRSGELNNQSIRKTLGKLRSLPIDTTRVFVFGFSGQGVQALAALFCWPELIRGVVATCAHAGAVPLADWERLGNRYVYLVSRQKDWNRVQNEQMQQLFNSKGLVTKLVLTPGEHAPGSARELLTACRWLRDKTKSR